MKRKVPGYIVNRVRCREQIDRVACLSGATVYANAARFLRRDNVRSEMIRRAGFYGDAYIEWRTTYDQPTVAAQCFWQSALLAAVLDGRVPADRRVARYLSGFVWFREVFRA